MSTVMSTAGLSRGTSMLRLELTLRQQSCTGGRRGRHCRRVYADRRFELRNHQSGLVSSTSRAWRIGRT